MLVLTRRVGDVVAIGDNIKVIVVSISGKQVRLGIEADRTTVIHREEIYQKIKNEGLSQVSSGIQSAVSLPETAPLQSEKKTIIVRKNQFPDIKSTDVN